MSENSNQTEPTQTESTQVENTQVDQTEQTQQEQTQQEQTQQEQTESTESKQVQEKKANTDPVPINIKFTGTSEKLIGYLMKKRIKALEGIVKYKIDWEGYPKDLESAKKLALEWSKLFADNKKYSGFYANIYFSMKKPTMRFEIKKYVKLEIHSEKITDSVENDDQFKNIVFNKVNKSTSGIYNYQFETMEKFPELSACKEYGKTWSQELESNPDNSPHKYVVFFNPSVKTVKVTVH